MTNDPVLDSIKDDLKHEMREYGFTEITDKEVWNLLYGFIAYEKADKLDKLIDALGNTPHNIFLETLFKAYSEAYEGQLQYIIRKGGKNVVHGTLTPKRVSKDVMRKHIQK